MSKLWPFEGLRIDELDWGAKRERVLKELDAQLDLLEHILVENGVEVVPWREQVNENERAA